jgi:Uma2 family endonuclease
MELTLDLNRQYTYADYLTWVDDKRRELVNGFVKLMSAASTAHGSISMNIATDLNNHIRRHNGDCMVFSAPFDVRLPRNGERENDKIYTVVQPDICVICDPAKLDHRGCLGAPDLVVEILSPSSLRYDLTEKFTLYESSGVREYWVVSPKEPSVNVFLLQPDGKYDSGTVYEYDVEAVPVHIFEGLQLQWKNIFRKFGTFKI